MTRGRPAKLPSPVLLDVERVPASVRAEGACVGAEPDLFFDDGKASDALQICDGCVVLLACRSYAIANEAFGVWGGMTAGQRAAARGGATAITPEARRESANLRFDLRNKPYVQIAEDRNCSRRSVERAAARLRRLDEAA